MPYASRAVALLLVVFSVLAPRAALGDTGIQDIPAGSDNIVALGEGKTAPFSGQLFDHPTALRWANWLLQYRLHLDQLQKLMSDRAEADKRLHLRQLDAVSQAHTVEVNWYKLQAQQQAGENAKLKLEIASPPFYKTMWFGFAVGAIVTGFAVGLGAGVMSAGK